MPRVTREFPRPGPGVSMPIQGAYMRLVPDDGAVVISKECTR